MSSRERPVDRAARLSHRALTVLGDEIREARTGAGLSQAAVGAAAGVSHTTVGRIERGHQLGADVRLLSRVCAVVGLDLSVRAFPGGDPIRDVAQVKLLARLRDRLGPGLSWRTEVPLPAAGDPRAWDAMVGDGQARAGVEAESRIRDVQALDRRIGLKRRDDGISEVILLVADTAANRRVLAASREALRANFPLDGREILRALAAGRVPGGSGILVL